MDKTVDDVKAFIAANFDDEIAERFEDQGIDGKALLMLINKGNSEQFEACGLITVGEQLHLRGLVEGIMPSVGASRMAVSAEFRSGKPTKNKIKSLSEIDQKVYKIKRKQVRTTAIKKIPGNDLPNFKLSKQAKKDLEDLTDSLVNECSHDPAGFGRTGIKQHIIDVLNERRRHHRNGRDYEQSQAASSVTSGSSTPDTIPVNPSDDENIEVTPKRPCYSKILLASDDEKQNDTSEEELSEENVTDEEGVVTERQMEKSNKGEKVGMEKVKEKDLKSPNKIKGTDAAVIVCVAFQAIKLADVSRTQLYSAAKVLGVSKECKKDKANKLPIV